MQGIRFGAICTALGVLLTQTGKPQKTNEQPRAGLELRCPTYSLACCQPMTLQADVFGDKETLGEEQAKLIAYRWEVSGGKIISGQGTAKIKIDAGELPSSGVDSIRVTLRLDGGPPELEKEKSCTLTIDPNCPQPTLVDQYGDLSLADEKRRLDRLATYLTNEGSGSVAFLVTYAGRESCFWEAELRSERAKKYLISNYKIQADRVMAIDGGFRENLTMDLFTSPCPSCGPFPTPTLVGSKANVKGSCRDKYKEAVGP
jgi:hypothetical protein